jgi:hypothetical protein
MTDERLALVSNKNNNNFYSGQQVSSGEPGTNGISRYILHGVTVISVLIACGCSIYGVYQVKSLVILFPLIIVIMWFLIHLLLLFFSGNDKYMFQPPAWFIFVSSGHILIQSLVAIILALFKH